MTAPAPSRRRYGVLLIWCGGVAMVLAGAFTLAWVKLPEWQPYWVIEHSPWADPAVRAMIAGNLSDYRHARRANERIMAWGPAIGPQLRRQYEAGSPDVRGQVLVLAGNTIGRFDGGGFSLFRDDPGSMRSDEMQEGHLFRPWPDGRPLSTSGEEALRADLKWLAIRASTDDSWDIRYRVLPLIIALRDPDVSHLPCDWLVSGTAGINLGTLLAAIADIKDHRAVPRLIPLLVTTPDPFERTLVSYALRKCLASSQVAEVLNATLHPDRYVREWAASVIDRVNADPALEAQLLRLLSDSESDVRLAALGTVTRKGIPNEFHPAFIARLGDETHEIRWIAMDAIITQKVPPAFRPAFIALLIDPAVDMRLVVIDAIGELRIREAGELLLTRLKEEPVLSLRISIIEALGRLEHIDAKPVLRQIAVVPTDPLQGAAIVTLGTLRDPTDFPLLLSLLANDDDDIARKARIAISYLPLTPDQQKKVDALWEAGLDDEAPAPVPPITSPP